jgi:hypothetical protein
MAASMKIGLHEELGEASVLETPQGKVRPPTLLGCKLDPELEECVGKRSIVL